MLKPGETYLINTAEWFTADDGQDYKAVFGTVRELADAEKVLGIKTNEKSTNWYVIIGTERPVVIAGCQIHYVIKTDMCAEGPSLAWHSNADKGLTSFKRPSVIFMADKKYMPAMQTLIKGLDYDQTL